MEFTMKPEPLSQIFTRREFALVQVSQESVGRLTDPSAQQHLRAGFERRVLLNQTSRLHIERVAAPERKDVLDTYACSELNVHLNSFYVQLRGALDNLAWIMHFEYDLLGAKNELDFETRANCSLFHKRFQQCLDAIHPPLVKFLREKQAWFDAFTKLRDPVAHRVPLYATPGVIREGSPQAARHMELQQDIARAIEANDLNLMRDKMFESFRIGTYEPWFTQYGSDGYVVRNIRAQIEIDHGAFLDIAEAVFSFVFVSQ